MGSQVKKYTMSRDPDFYSVRIRVELYSTFREGEKLKELASVHNISI